MPRAVPFARRAVRVRRAPLVLLGLFGLLALPVWAAPAAAQDRWDDSGDYGLTEADPADPVFDSPAFRHFAAAFADQCHWGDAPEAARIWAPQSWDLEWTPLHSDAPARATLYRFYCDSGAYNVRFVWYLDGGHEGRPTPLAFAAPQFDVVPADNGSEGAADDITLRGWAARTDLVNAQYDPQRRAIVAVDHWRGLGDAFTRGVWAFEDGEFLLKRYEIDATYDGEIAPQRVLTFD